MCDSAAKQMQIRGLEGPTGFCIVFIPVNLCKGEYIKRLKLKKRRNRRKTSLKDIADFQICKKIVKI